MSLVEITLRKINSSQDKSFSELYKIYKGSFIDDEIREINQAQLDKKVYSLYVVEVDNMVGGLISTWDLDKVLFVEHVAISDVLRGKGVGSMVFDKIHKANQDRNVVLEVERPYDKDSERRIGFYQRLGYCLNMYEYIQPPISLGKSPVPMYLMTRPEAVCEKDYISIRDLLYSEVYTCHGNNFLKVASIDSCSR